LIEAEAAKQRPPVEGKWIVHGPQTLQEVREIAADACKLWGFPDTGHEVRHGRMNCPASVVAEALAPHCIALIRAPGRVLTDDEILVKRRELLSRDTTSLEQD
jgi:hypothetical protein